MIKRYILAAMLIVPWVAPAHGATVTSAVKLVDSDGDGKITVAKAITVPPSAKGTNLYDCGSASTPFVYAVATKDACPVKPVEAPSAIAAPRVSVPCVPTLTPVSSNGSGGNSAQWVYASAGKSYGNYCSTRAADLIIFGGNSPGPINIHDIVATGNRHFLTTKPKNTSYKVDNVTIERIEASAYKRGIYIRAGSSNWLIQDFKIWTTSVNDSPGDIPVGIGIMGGHNIVIRRGEIWGFQSKFSGGYPNADCISAERGDSLSVFDTHLHDCTDGGIDTKGDTVLDNVTSEGNGKNFKFWLKVRAGSLVSINPHVAHIIIMTADADVVIDKVTAVGDKPVLVLDGNAIDKTKARMAHITINSCDLARWTGTSFVGTLKQAVITLGPTCQVKPATR